MAERDTLVTEKVETAEAPSTAVDAEELGGLTEEELEQVRERNGLIRAMDAALADIRQRSFAPEGMAPDAFE